jgi:hypothetical protein
MVSLPSSRRHQRSPCPEGLKTFIIDGSVFQQQVITSSDRQSITEAVSAIDALLASAPFGEMTRELAEGLRSATAIPLRVIYAVEDEDKIVDVATVRMIDPPLA